MLSGMCFGMPVGLVAGPACERPKLTVGYVPTTRTTTVSAPQISAIPMEVTRLGIALVAATSCTVLDRPTAALSLEVVGLSTQPLPCHTICATVAAPPLMVVRACQLAVSVAFEVP